MTAVIVKPAALDHQPSRLTLGPSIFTAFREQLKLKPE